MTRNAQSKRSGLLFVMMVWAEVKRMEENRIFKAYLRGLARELNALKTALKEKDSAAVKHCWTG